MKNKKLSSVLNGMVGILVIFAIIGCAYVYIQSVQKNVQEEINQYLGEVCIQGAALVKEKFNGGEGDITSMANVIEQIDYALDDPRILNTLDAEATTTDFQDVTIILPNGTAYEKKNGEIFTFNAFDREYFKKSMEGITFVSSPLLPADGSPESINISTPIHRNGSVVGVLAGRYFLEDLKELMDINTFGGKGYSYIARSNGDVFVPSNHESSNKSLKNILTGFDDAIFKDPEALLNMEKIMQENKSGNLSYERNGSERLMSYSPIGINDWYFLSVVPNEIVSRKTANLVRDAAIFCAVLFIIFALLLLYAYREELRKKEELRQAHRELGDAKSRYEIILAQTEDIVFEWNIPNKSINYSEVFEKRMGHAPETDNFPNAIISTNWICKEDESLFLELFHKIEEGEAYAEAALKVVVAEGHSEWYRVRISLVSDEKGCPSKGVGVMANIDREMREKERMIKAAEKDTLTDLYNKGTAETKIKKWFKQMGSFGNAALLILDIDDFKQINDTFGHLHGDKVLKDISLELAEIFRETDVVGRIGGDEFIILMKGIQNQEIAGQKAEEIIKVYEAYRVGEEKRYTVSCSMGIALCPRDGNDYKSLFKKADEALYFAKNRGKNQYAFYEEKKK